MNNLINGVLEGDIEKVKDLIERVADLEFRDKDGCTTFNKGSRRGIYGDSEAAYSGHTEVVKVLIEKGACINAKNIDGDTAADLAEEEGYKNIVALLS